MKTKRSFLDKITRSSSAAEQEPEEVIINKETGEEETPEETQIEESSIIIQEEEEEEENSSSQGWQQQESEGQLTIDVYQTDSEIVIKSTIAGVTAEDLDVNITNDMVTIKGKREDDTKEPGRDYYYQECYWGSFSRSIILPVDIEAENASAEIKNGILTIRLPKAEKVKTKKIKVVGK